MNRFPIYKKAMELKTRETETIIQQKSSKRKPQPKTTKQKYDYPKEELTIGSKEEKLKMSKILNLLK